MAESQSTVEYRPIEGYPGYRVGNDGTVWTLRLPFRRTFGNTWRQVSQHPARGYLHASLFADGKHRRFSVHRLVLAAFVSPPCEGQQGCHIDGCRTNNCLSNLRWGTQLDNEQDKLRHGRRRIGERHQNSILTEGDVLEIRSLRASGVTWAKLAKQFGVSISTVRDIAAGRSWKYLLQSARDGETNHV